MTGATFALTLAVAFAHPLVDGSIDRASQTIVREDKIEVVYFLGMSPKTLEVELRAMVPEGEIVPSDEQTQLERYRQLIGERLLERVQLTVNDQAVPLAVVAAEIVPRETFILEVRFEAALPEQERNLAVEFRDLNFFGVAGFQRAALRPHGDVELVSGEAQAAIVRVPRIEWEQLTPLQRRTVGAVAGKFKRP